MAQASPSANPKLDRVESQAAPGAMLRRGAAPADSTDGAPQKSDFPLSLGRPKSTRLKAAASRTGSFSGCWSASLHAFSLLPDFILYRLGIALGGLIFYRFDRRHRKIGIRNLEIAFPGKKRRRARAHPARVVHQPRPLPAPSTSGWADSFYRGLARRSHLQSPRRIGTKLTPTLPRQGRADPDARTSAVSRCCPRATRCTASR